MQIFYWICSFFLQKHPIKVSSRHSRNELFSYWFFADSMPQIVAAQLRSLVSYNSIFVSNIGVWVCICTLFFTNTNNPYLCILLSSSHRNNHNDVDLYLLRVNSSWNVFFSSANNRLRPYKVHFLRNFYFYLYIVIFTQGAAL